MDEQAMLTRDLVLRLCANATEFDHEWIREERKIVAPFTAPRDTSLIDTVVEAGRAMGVDRLLACRTRAEFAYEPVTEVPTDSGSIVDLIRSWGSEPTDLLFAVEDLSAAVLVTSSTLTVAAGPDDFVGVFVGPDIAGARAEFGTRAREGDGDDLAEAARRYGCAREGGQASEGRVPGPDLAERLGTRARSLRHKGARAVAGLRVVRGVWGWAMLVVLLLSLAFVPGLPAAVPVLLGTLWLMAQLAWPARSRTVSFATLLRVLVLGAIVLWPVALAEQALAGAAGVDPAGWFGHTYIAVPVEEVAKLAPLVLCRLVARRRFRRLAAVDYLLLAAASGAGFHLAEQGLHAVARGGPPPLYWPHFGVLTLFPGWIDAPWLGIQFSGHAVTTGLIGAALGLAIVGHRHYGGWLWLLPLAAVWVAALEHMNINAAQSGVEPTAVTAVLAAIAGNGLLTRWLLLLLLVVAVVMDYRIARPAADTTPPLPGTPPFAGLRRWARGRVVRARVRIPGDIAPVFRRAALAWVRLPLALISTAASILHEFAVMIVAARQGPRTLCATWRFLRERRAHAMGAARAGGRPWRGFPTGEELGATERELESALRVAPAVSGVGAAAVLALTVDRHPAVEGTHDPAAYAFAAAREAQSWLGSLPPETQPWALAAVLAVLSLLASGWTVPHAYPTVREFLRAPSRNIGTILGAFAPGQVPYALVVLAGMVLPRGVSRLLGRR